MWTVARDYGGNGVSAHGWESRETVYADYAGGKWEYLTYVDGQRCYVNETTARTMVRQGARVVNCAPIEGFGGVPPIGRGTR